MRRFDAGPRGASRLLAIPLALLAIFTLPVALCCAVLLANDRTERIYFTVFLFLDVIPFAMSVIYLIKLYRHSRSAAAKPMVDLASLIFTLSFPFLAYWQTRYVNHDKRALFPSLLLAIDALPSLFGILWLSSRLPQNIIETIKRRRGYVVTAALIIGAIVAMLKMSLARR